MTETLYTSDSMSGLLVNAALLFKNKLLEISKLSPSILIFKPFTFG